MMMQDKERQLLNELYVENFQAMYCYALAVLNNDAQAQEAVQMVFLTACQKPDKVYNSPNPVGWLYITLRNNFHNMASARFQLARLLIQLTIIEGPEQIAGEEPEIDLDVLYGDLVGQECYELVKKFAVDGHTLAELSDEYGISIAACKQRLCRGKQKMREILRRQNEY